MKKKKRESRSIKWQIINLLIVCWLIPLILMIGVFAYYIMSNHFGRTVNSYVDQLEFNVQLSAQRLDAAVDASRAASYDKTIRDNWELYEKGQLGNYNLFKNCEKYLTSKYLRDQTFCDTILWFYEDPKNRTCSIYNESVGGTYQDIVTYWQQDHEMIETMAKELDTGVGFINCNDRLYMIRNLVSGSYEPFAALVMRLNETYCFANLEDIPLAERFLLKLNDEPFLGDMDAAESFVFPEGTKAKNGYFWRDGMLYIYSGSVENGYRMQAAETMPGSVMMMPFYGWQYIFGGMLIALIPLLWIFIRNFRRQIEEPIGELFAGAKKIEDGELGFQITAAGKNPEFQYLQDSFNHMSIQLQNFFNRIYKEEIALRDARIMALQAHINPHFMNNTLEIINWEARLGGNEKISRMIESLSVLMDAAMDRQKKPEVTLAEEMTYVEAYLHITRERLGKRLTVVQEIPDGLLSCQVPRLILQPVIENAVQHGIIPRRKGTISLKARMDGEYLIIEIENDGSMTPEDEARIARLLNDDYDTSKEGSVNLGIANVNQRLRILYGAPSGLRITKRTEEVVCASLTIPRRTLSAE